MPPLDDRIARAIKDATGQASPITRRVGAGGGCISQSTQVQLHDGRTFFLKCNADPLPGMFAREAEALRALRAADAIRVPEVIGHGERDADSPAFLLLEAIPAGRPAGNFFETFGRQFAQLHLNTRHSRFGFDHDNYIGATPQPNDWRDDWVAFWREHRLGFQLDLARRNGLSSPEMDRLGRRLLDRLDDYLALPDEPACLLHGDLWGGNYLCDDHNSPVLIDPAAYYGRREADLAMTQVFGGFSPAFYRAYEEVWPLADGADARLELYQLYHLLNHLNLFGSGYAGQCLSLLRRYA